MKEMKGSGYETGATDLSTVFLESKKRDMLDFIIKFTVPHNVGPSTHVRGMLARLLYRSGCRHLSRKRVTPIPRAEYEEQAREYWYQALLTLGPDEKQDRIVAQLIQKLCYFGGGGFHDQILADISSIKSVFAEIRTSQYVTYVWGHFLRISLLL
ncbi:unnamed protein product [Haemonchus placei]|uniref:TBCD n=1 Tax=Haemonchus placei TaxID=6290 RepID=A0A158QMN4_HAEPC|nr:unnamed protein product [Haemonchus placei]